MATFLAAHMDSDRWWLIAELVISRLDTVTEHSCHEKGSGNGDASGSGDADTVTEEPCYANHAADEA